MSEHGAYSYDPPAQPWVVPLRFDITDLPDSYLEQVLKALQAEDVQFWLPDFYTLVLSVKTVPVNTIVEAVTYAFGYIRSIMHEIPNVSTFGWPERTTIRDLYKSHDRGALPDELIGCRIGYLPPTPIPPTVIIDL